MARHHARREDDNIETDFAIGAIGVSRPPQFGGADDTALAAVGHRLHRLLDAIARLDLDEDQDAAPAGNDVDFAERRFPTPREDAVGLGDQKQRRAAFRRKAERKASTRSGRGTGFGDLTGSARRAIFFIFCERERALIDLAPRTAGGLGNFSHRILQRMPGQRFAQ